VFFIDDEILISQYVIFITDNYVLIDFDYVNCPLMEFLSPSLTVISVTCIAVISAIAPDVFTVPFDVMTICLSPLIKFSLPLMLLWLPETILLLPCRELLLLLRLLLSPIMLVWFPFSVLLLPVMLIPMARAMF
jgi:hypothetical protein